MNGMIYIVVQLGVILLLAPLLNGIIKKVKARTQKRKGAPLLQLYRDLFKQLRKERVASTTASWVFFITPYVVFAVSVIAALFVPITQLLPGQGFAWDIIVFVYLLGLGRFFMTLAALDTGSTFGGMGSSRELMISALMEPALILALFSAGVPAGATSLTEMMKTASASIGTYSGAMYLLLFMAVFLLLLAETSRIPVDDPSTHLELTMVHEAMLLEYSGGHLALMEYAASIKQLVLVTLLINLFLPFNLDAIWLSLGIPAAAAIILSIATYIIKALLMAVIVGIVETFTVKLRLFSVPNLAALAFIMAFLGFVQNFVLGR